MSTVPAIARASSPAVLPLRSTKVGATQNQPSQVLPSLIITAQLSTSRASSSSYSAQPSSQSGGRRSS